MEPIGLFFQEVTEELLYNIVYEEDEIDYRDLSERFEDETAYRPMDFFGLGNITDGGWFDFIHRIPGVEGTKMISIIDDSDSSDEDSDSSDEDSEDDDDGYVYRMFNRTSFDEGTVAKYREMILIRCCEIMKDDLDDLSDCSDEQGNTPLHFIAALPGVSKDCNTLVKYLLEAGVDPLATNDDGKTFLHTIFGRYEVEEDSMGDLQCFTNERVPKTKWFVEDRVELLVLLSEVLSEKDTALLAKSQDNSGNTVLHEYAISTIVQPDLITEDQLCKCLLSFGSSVRVQNNSGEVPLHYAHNSSVFKIFLQNGASCRARNDRDETPVLLLLKNSVQLASDKIATADVMEQCIGNITQPTAINEAVRLLRNLKKIISQNKEAMKTVWIPDMQDNTSIEIVLAAIRITSYGAYTHFKYISELRTSLMELLREMLSSATTFANQPAPQSRLMQGMSNLRINETRKIRSCPKRHVESAQCLANPSTQVTVVGKYRYFNQHSIGNGAFSSVFVAIKDENVNSRSGTIECRAFALKRLDKAKINPQEIKREITTLLSISGECDNIIKCHEAVEDSFFQYLCLDLMDGDLQEFVSNDNVNIVMKKDPLIHGQIAKGIIDGLAYLHGKNFVHRDLKPGNILYTTDPKLHFKITDFGLTKNLSTFCTMTSTRGSGVAMAPGTRCWLAPELLNLRSKEHTQQSDIFSLGLVLHYLFTLGNHPFASRSEEPAHVIERKIVSMQISLDRALPPEATSFLQILLREDPSKRPSTSYINQHPFFWSESKKIEFLKAVGDQPEAVNPGNFNHSQLEESLQTTNTGRKVTMVSWDRDVEDLYDEMTQAWRQKKYRTDKVIDLLRFIRNAYAHKQERTLEAQEYLDKHIFLRVHLSLVLDVFGVIQQLEFDNDENRSNIRKALSLET